MTNEDLDRLQKVAEQATSGEWESTGLIDVEQHQRGYRVRSKVGKILVCRAPGSSLADSNDIRHIAAFDPPTVFKLIAMARHAVVQTEK
jgi:hypothetical protein